MNVKEASMRVAVGVGNIDQHGFRQQPFKV
jgi:hypothetical protein